jgi:hypothetical protein
MTETVKMCDNCIHWRTDIQRAHGDCHRAPKVVLHRGRYGDPVERFKYFNTTWNEYCEGHQDFKYPVENNLPDRAVDDLRGDLRGKAGKNRH